MYSILQSHHSHKLHISKRTMSHTVGVLYHALSIQHAFIEAKHSVTRTDFRTRTSDLITLQTAADRLIYRNTPYTMIIPGSRWCIYRRDSILSCPFLACTWFWSWSWPRPPLLVRNQPFTEDSDYYVSLSCLKLRLGTTVQYYPF